MTRDEFCNSVFELADQWTSTTDAEEYLSFLDVGYRQVFQASSGVLWPISERF